MNCKICGSELEDEALFCSNCGAKVEKSEEVKEEETVSVVAADEPENAATVQEEAYVKPEPTVYEAPEFNQAANESTEVSVESEVRAEKSGKELKAEQKAAEKEEKKATRAIEKRRYQIKRNSAFTTVFSVILSILLTGVLFMATAIFTLANTEFDEFYKTVVLENLEKYIDFWILTSYWYAIATYTVFALLVLLIFFVLKRRKYAILNYVGIPAIINGVIFVIIGYFSDWINSVFSTSGVIEELLDTVENIAGQIVTFNGLVLIAAGVVAVLVYLLVSVIHKAVYRRKCRKAENVA